MTQEGTQTTLRSLADLASIFPEAQAVSPARAVGPMDLMGLPLLQRLQAIHRQGDGESKIIDTIKRSSVREALEMDPQERQQLGIRIAAILPLDELDRLFASEVSNYPIYLLFPFYRLLKYVGASRVSLGNSYDFSGETPDLGILQEIDRAVAANAELIDEGPVERHNRLLQEIKMADTLIKGQKSTFRDLKTTRAPRALNRVWAGSYTKRMNELNLTKSDRVLEYLKTAHTLTSTDPTLPVPFRLIHDDDSDSLHRTLEMWHLKASGLSERFSGIAAPVRVTGLGMRSVTNINVQALQTSKDRYLQGSELPDDQIRYQLAEMLGL